MQIKPAFSKTFVFAVHTAFSFENAGVYENLHFGNRSGKPPFSVAFSSFQCGRIENEAFSNENALVWTGPQWSGLMSLTVCHAISLHSMICHASACHITCFSHEIMISPICYFTPSIPLPVVRHASGLLSMSHALLPICNDICPLSDVTSSLPLCCKSRHWSS